MHRLDLNYHKQSSKNTVFAINRALRSLEGGLKLVLGVFSSMAIEFTFLCVALTYTCGPRYLLNMLFTLGAYTYYTNYVSTKRIAVMKQKMMIDKRLEFY